MPRYHLSFQYEGGHKKPSHGDQVEICDTIEQAAKRLMIERSITKIHILKRFGLGKPASEAELINKIFEI